MMRISMSAGGNVILLVDLPLYKRDFTGPTFVYKPSRNIIPALSQKIKIRALV